VNVVLWRSVPPAAFVVLKPKTRRSLLHQDKQDASATQAPLLTSVVQEKLQFSSEAVV
jgi:hypothetical protein